MRILLAFILALPILAQITSPTSPQVIMRTGETKQFAGSCPAGHTCIFDLAPGHGNSSITAGGFYTAPTSAPRHYSELGGCQVQAHNSIYNVRVDQETSGLGTYANSDDQVMQILASTTGPKGFSGGTGGPVNDVNNSTTTVQFAYPGYEGYYPWATPYFIPFGSRTDPLSQTQTGWLGSVSDNRYMYINRDNCEYGEFYFWAGFSGKTPPFNIPMAVSNSMEMRTYYGVSHITYPGSTAGGLNLAAMQLSVSQLEKVADTIGDSGDLGHVLSFTLSNLAIYPMGGIAPYTEPKYYWPATRNAGGCGPNAQNPTPCTPINGVPQAYGTVKYGTRFRLRPQFVTWYVDNYLNTEYTNPRQRTMIRILLNTFVRYGVIMMDGTVPSASFQMHGRSEPMTVDAERAISALSDKTKHLAWNDNYGPLRADGVLISHMEAVDESSLMANLESNAVLAPYTQPERVLYIDTTDSNRILGYRDIAINIPTVGAIKQNVTVVSGASAPLGPLVWATGLENNSAISWEVRPGSIGQVTTSGVYSPGATVNASIATVRAYATADPSAYYDFKVAVLPAIGSKLCIRLANAPNETFSGMTCWGRDSSTGSYLNVSGGPSTAYLGIYMASSIVAGGLYPKNVYNMGASGDQSFPIYLPNGRYKITSLFFPPWNTPAQLSIDLQNQESQVPINWYSYVGNVTWRGHYVTGATTVSDGKLIYSVKSHPNNLGYGLGAMFPAIIIEPDNSVASVVGGNAVIGGSAKMGGN